MANQLSLGLLVAVLCKIRTGGGCRDFRLLFAGVEWSFSGDWGGAVLPKGF